MKKEYNDYIVAWKRENTFRVMLQFNKEKDKEIIEVLKNCENKNDLVRKALQEYIKK